MLSAKKTRDRQKYLDIIFLILIGGDFVMVVLGLLLGFWVRFRTGLVSSLNTSIGFIVDVDSTSVVEYSQLVIVGSLLLVITFWQMNLYRQNPLVSYRRVVGIIVKSLLLWFGSYLGLSLALKFNPPISRIYVLISTFTVAIAVMLWRRIVLYGIRINFVANVIKERVVFIGWSDEARKILNGIQSELYHPYKVIGWISFVDNLSKNFETKLLPRLGCFDDLISVLKRHSVDHVIMVDLTRPPDHMMALTSICEKEMVGLKVIPSNFQIFVSGLKLDVISGVPVLGVSELPLDKLSNRTIKTLFDIIGAIVGLMISLPIVAVFGIIIYLESPGSIFFAQERVGKKGQRFRMFKLRSMHLDADKFDNLSQSTRRNDPRMLKIGAIIRRWNIDELPQFWNVLCGQMSLVGPRPERTFHSDRLSDCIPHYSARLMSKPGMTGWAQVNGLRGDTDLNERVRFDLFYLENWSLWLDLQILVQTIIWRRNAY